MTEYSNADGTSIDVPDDLLRLLGPGWSRAGSRSSASASDSEPEPQAEKPEPAAAPPPRSGKGSSDANWTTYARSQGVDVSDDMSRKDVIAACEKAGVAVE